MIEILTEKDYSLIKQVVLKHNQAPLSWNPNYTYTEEEVREDEDRITSDLRQKKAVVLYEKCNERVIAFVWAEISSHDLLNMEITSLWVEEEYRTQQKATLLKIKLEEYCLQKGFKSITSTVFKENNNMLNLNQKLGYEIAFYSMKKNIRG